MQSYVRILPKAQRPQTITGKNTVPIHEKGRVYISLAVHIEILQPDDNDPSVKTQIETNNTVFTPIFEGTVYS